jgi:yeast amino acid transporter
MAEEKPSDSLRDEKHGHGDDNLSDGSPHRDGSKADVQFSSSEHSKLPFWTRMGCTPESFKRRTLADKHNQLNQTLRARHLHMIAIGGSIGAGLFVGSGSALANGGPASLLIDFFIIGVVCYYHLPIANLSAKTYGLGC